MLADQSPHFRRMLSAGLHRPKGIRKGLALKRLPCPAEGLWSTKRTGGTENAENIVVPALARKRGECMTHPTNVRRLMSGERLGAYNYFCPVTAGNPAVGATVRAAYHCIENPAPQGRENCVSDEGKSPKSPDIFTGDSPGSGAGRNQGNHLGTPSAQRICARREKEMLLSSEQTFIISIICLETERG